MKHTKLIALLATSIAFLTACDESTTENITQVNQVGMDVVSAEKDLPECTAENEGAQAFVKGESSARVCVNEDWVPMTSSVKDTVYVKDSDLSCKTEPLADSSGLKIICNGDSIGVVLNGAKGEKGDAGEPGGEGEPGAAGVGCSIAGQTDSTMTVACGTDTTTIQLNYSKTEDEQESSVDFYQKGFFLRGTDVYLYEVNGSFNQVGTIYQDQIVEDKGWRCLNRDVNYPYVKIIFDGFYRNVVTGKRSNVPVTLVAYVDISAHVISYIHINPLTHLEHKRAINLLHKENLKLKEAKTWARADVLNQFSIDTTGVKSFEDVSMFDATEASAKLLAVIILLQGDRSEVEFTELLAEIADDIAEDGEWNNVEKKKEIATWAKNADESGRLNEIREHIVKGTDIVFPDFAQYIRKFYKAELGD